MDVVSACLFGFDAIIVPFFVGEQLPAAGLAEELVKKKERRLPLGE